MIRPRHFIIFILFVFPTTVTFAQSGGKTVSELFSEVEISKKVRLLGDKCWSLREINSDSAIILGQQALQLAIQYDIRKELPRLYGFIGVVQLHYLYKTKESIPYLHRALEYSLQQKDSVQLAYSYNNLGDLYLLTGNIPLALKFSEYSLQIFNILNHSAGKSYAYVNMGLVYREKKDFDLALDYFEKAKSLWKELGDELGMGSVTMEIARTYEAKGDIDVAMTYYQQSYQKSLGSSNVRYAAFCLSGMANIFYLKKEYNKAFDYYQKALKLDQERRHNFGLVDDYISLALVYAHKNERKEAETALHKALGVAGKLGLNAKILKTYRAFVELYKVVDDQSKAMASYDRFSLVYDSILSIQQFEIIEEMQNRFMIRQTLSETEQELESRKFQELYLVIIIILMLIIAVILYWRYQSQRKLNLQLAEINQTKDKLFSVISHDLKNPFNSLIGFSGLLVEESREGDYQNTEKFAGYIHQSSVEGMKLLTNLLDWSRSQTGAISYYPTSISFDRMFDELNSFFDSDLQQYKIKIEFHNLIEEEVMADPDILRTILNNLISNAIKYTNEGGLIRLDAARTKSHVNIKVKDSGTGMSQEIMDRLFDNSKTTNSTQGLHNEQGTGLGLSICAELIRIHKGTIKVKSELGKGSTFEIEFPG
ncbi:tetratricopeptide repeat protein [Labilibaculum sp. K2S]|uniref:tetratricopeptide repeat-containing sensor histidine kinase n=1 Tax=Labilibaculum sp. K2S TaxID=3056386 RepID=UPI0025A3EC8C|nr:tetratricopeptide repeat protein [Labilibaculum sp. K2S]MDM8159625.1 tetratricopeptide repeat protein [Labilibaculum sp. K2S]